MYVKLVAERLIDILPFLIHPDQSEFTKGSQASDATRRVIDVIHHFKSSGTPSLLLSLDAEKAFNTLGLPHSVLTKFGFEGQIFKAIMALYTTPSARVYTSSHLPSKHMELGKVALYHP